MKGFLGGFSLSEDLTKMNFEAMNCIFSYLHHGLHLTHVYLDPVSTNNVGYGDNQLRDESSNTLPPLNDRPKIPGPLDRSCIGEGYGETYLFSKQWFGPGIMALQHIMF